MKWFRLYNDAVDDEKLRLLAFEDRWHYVAILCLKSDGLLDTPANELRDRKIALKLGLSSRDAEEVKRRLTEVGLINKNWQPKAWKKRQYEHDSSAARTRKYREKKRLELEQQKQIGDGYCDVTVTSTDTETDTDTEKESREYKFAENFYERVLSVYPKTKKPNLSKWAQTIERTCRLDNRTIEELWDVFVWANKNEFWSTNIMSPDKLRKQFDRLAAEKQRESTKPQKFDPNERQAPSRKAL